jgi:hypothetical protein
MDNLGDVVARTGVQLGVNAKLVDHILNEHEEDEIYQSALKDMAPLGKGIDIPMHNGRTYYIDINLTDGQFDSIINGTMNLYLALIGVFTDEATPSGKTNLAIECIRYSKNTDTPLACLGHHEARLEN